ncbi:hypothetical protein SUDANB145_04001 [Streptomyces sp. enrichment culture]
MARKKHKDWGLAASTLLALIVYRFDRVWDALLIGLVPVREALFPHPRRPARRGSGGRLVLLSAAGLLRTLHLPLTGATRWTRPDALALSGSHALRTKGTSDE